MKYIGDGVGSEGAVALYEHYGQVVKVSLSFDETERLSKAYEQLGLTQGEEENRNAQLTQLRKQVDELANPTDSLDAVLRLLLAEIADLRQAERVRSARFDRETIQEDRAFL